jgi:hypothetical protein
LLVFLFPQGNHVLGMMSSHLGFHKSSKFFTVAKVESNRTIELVVLQMVRAGQDLPMNNQRRGIA